MASLLEKAILGLLDHKHIVTIVKCMANKVEKITVWEVTSHSLVEI
jgi:hypothetical protein